MLSYINDFPMEFRNYIASKIIPQYADFDKAHRVDHVLKVIAESLKLSQYYDVNRMMVYVIASYHDLGLCEGREFKVFEKIYSQETETIQNLENIPIFVRNKKNNSI